MSYRKGVSGVNRMDGEGNESVYGKFGMFFLMNCGVFGVVKLVLTSN